MTAVSGLTPRPDPAGYAIDHAIDHAIELEAPEVIAPPPRWISPVFIVLGVGLILWTLILAFTLPSRHGTHHYAAAWTGFDIALAVLLIATAVGTARRAAWLQGVAAAAAAAFLVCDAWFDVLSSTSTDELVIAVGLALFVELPVAAACILVSRYAKETTEHVRGYAAVARRRRRPA